MKNGECPTWFVVKWLTKHPTHTAVAPKNSGKLRSRASVVRDELNGNLLQFDISASKGWEIDMDPYIRSDWTIYNERGEPVKFKPKRESLIIGELLPGEDLVVCSGETRSNIIRNCGADTVDILIRSRRK